MDEQPVLIALTSRQDLDGEVHLTKQSFPGRLLRKPDGWVVSWQEPPDSGLGETRTELILRQRWAQLSRQGAFSARLPFQEGKRLPARYATPYGLMPVEVCARSVCWDLSAEEGGRVALDYSLFLGDEPPIRTSLTLSLAPA